MVPDRSARGVLRARAKVLIAVLILLLTVAAPALAQGDNKAAARDHFAKGVAAFDDRRFGEAAEEFETAYRLSPAFVVLYNIGQVDVVLGRAVEAVDAFDRYLKQGASAIPENRQQEVRQEIEKQLGRIGEIDVRTSPAGAEVRVDGSLLGTTPLAKRTRLTAGKHTVQATLAGYLAQVRDVDVGGRAEIEIEMALEPVVANDGAAAPGPASPTAPASVAPRPPPSPATADIPARSSSPPAAPPVTADQPVVEKTFIERTYIEAPAPVPAPTPSHAASGETSTFGNVQRVVSYVVIAGGLVTTTVGGLLAYSGANQANEASIRLANAATAAEWNQIKPDFDSAKRRNQTGWAVAGIGAAVLIGGVVGLATVPQRASVLSLGPWMTAETGGLVLKGAW